MDKPKCFRFNKCHDHNNDDCIQLKDPVDGHIKNGRLIEYVKGCKRDMDKSSRGKSPRRLLMSGPLAK